MQGSHSSHRCKLLRQPAEKCIIIATSLPGRLYKCNLGSVVHVIVELSECTLGELNCHRFSFVIFTLSDLLIGGLHSHSFPCDNCTLNVLHVRVVHAKFSVGELHSQSFHQLGPSGLSWSSRRYVCLFVCLMSPFSYF